MVRVGNLTAPRRGRSFGVLDGFRGADTAAVPVASQLLRGAEVFVLNGDAQYSKARASAALCCCGPLQDNSRLVSEVRPTEQKPEHQK